MMHPNLSKPLAGIIVAAGLAFSLTGTVQAQTPVYTCGSNITMTAIGEQPFYINEPIPVVVTLEAGTVSNGTDDGVLHINSFDYKPDCEPGSTFETCSVTENNVTILTADGDIVTDCGTTFTRSPLTDGALTYVFTPDQPVVLAPQETCDVGFDIMVLGVQQDTVGILEWGGWAESQVACYTTDEPPVAYPEQVSSAASGSLYFPLSTERVTFRVTKNFSDNSLETATVRLRCNAGLPLENEFDLSDGEHVTFVVKDFPAGGLNCQVYEDPIGLYEPTYAPGGTGTAANMYGDADGCWFEGIQGGSFTCDVTNSPDDVEIVVNKEWYGVDDVDFPLVAEAEYTCFDVFTTPTDTVPVDVSGTLSFFGTFSSDVIGGIYPVPGRSYCTVTEVNLESTVDSDASDCARIPVIPGAECTLVNTLFFEGIPTLSQYGQMLMALLMLGVGMVGLRRFV